MIEFDFTDIDLDLTNEDIGQ